jgi:hypothetical protein
LASILLVGFSYILNKTGVELPINKANPKNLFQLYGQYTFLVVAVIGPIIEESIFRLPLKLRKLNISVAIICLFLLLWHKLHLNIQMFFLFVAVIALLIILLNYKVSKSRLRLFQIKYISYLKWGSIVGFALMHLVNYEIDSLSHLFIICIFLLPVFSLSLFITLVRLKAGFVYSTLMHCANNFIALAFYFL